ncbi:hypothetical protein AX16_009109, partial [Volvariella volvacea WC 439]
SDPVFGWFLQDLKINDTNEKLALMVIGSMPDFIRSRLLMKTSWAGGMNFHHMWMINRQALAITDDLQTNVDQVETAIETVKSIYLNGGCLDHTKYWYLSYIELQRQTFVGGMKKSHVQWRLHSGCLN